jgi:hypothetical protein
MWSQNQLQCSIEGARSEKPELASCPIQPYSLTGNTAIKLTQAKNFSNSPSGTTFWAQGVAEDRFGCYILALSVAGGRKSGK